METNTVRSQCFLLFIFALLFSAFAADARGTLQPVAPGRLYKGHYVNVRAPESSGWYLVGSSGISMEFERKGAKQDERYGAEVLLFPLPQAKTREEFLGMIKERFKAHTKRFTILKSDYTYSNKRSYPCVHISAVVEDKKAQAATGPHKRPALQFISLYCRHPVRQKTGFAIVYSHRGPSLDPNLETEAQSFADGVQVPEH